MAKQSPRAYPPEFRRKVIALARDGRPLNGLANEFGIARQTIMNWLRQEDLDAGRRDDGLTTSERQELTRLRRENKRLTLETEILKKAAAWFARETNAIPEKSSDS
jgi:transposase